MKWVKASERLPATMRALNLVWIDEEGTRRPLFGTYRGEGYFLTPLGRYEKEVVEWLDESPTQSQGNEQGKNLTEKLIAAMKISFAETVEKIYGKEPDIYRPTPQTESEGGGEIKMNGVTSPSLNQLTIDFRASLLALKVQSQQLQALRLSNSKLVEALGKAKDMLGTLEYYGDLYYEIDGLLTSFNKPQV